MTRQRLVRARRAGAADGAPAPRSAVAHNGAMRVVVLTGAGISAESGVRTFRDAGGLWEGHEVMDVATPEGFARDPELVLRIMKALHDEMQLREETREMEGTRPAFAPDVYASKVRPLEYTQADIRERIDENTGE